MMTFTINATVTRVSNIGAIEPDRTSVELEANAGEEVTNYGQIMQAVYSNTEGVIAHASIILTIEGTAPPLTKGDVVSFTGHFTAVPPLA